MRFADLLKENEKPVLSFEFFPPRDEKAAEKFDGVMDELEKLKPDFVTVTFGAGGSTKEGSYQLVEKLKNGRGLNVVAYLAGYGLGPEEITSVLDGYKRLGVETVFVIRGDAPRGKEDFKPHPGAFSYASDMLAYIKPKYDFCLGAAGYPEGHIEAVSRKKDLEYLKLKVDNGAEYITAQYFYDSKYFFNFVERCRAIGIGVPVLPGIMPIYTVKMMEMMAGLCGTAITDEVKDGLAKLPPDDKEAVLNFGIDFATRQCRELLDGGVKGLHFYTMDRAGTVVAVINRLRSEGRL